MKLTIVKTSKTELLLVKVPDGSSNFKLESFFKWLLYNEDEFIQLPYGNYQLIGLLKDITEEAAAELVDTTFLHKKHNIKLYKYVSYQDGFVGFESAKESLQSLCESHGFPENTVIIKKF